MTTEANHTLIWKVEAISLCRFHTEEDWTGNQSSLNSTFSMHAGPPRMY